MKVLRSRINHILSRSTEFVCTCLRSFLFQSVAFVQTVIDSALHSSFVNLLSCLPFPVMYVVPFCFCALLFGECIVAPRMDQCRFLSVRVSIAIILFYDHFFCLFQSTAFSPLCSMSSITLTGFFGLLHGKRVSRPKAADADEYKDHIPDIPNPLVFCIEYQSRGPPHFHVLINVCFT